MSQPDLIPTDPRELILAARAAPNSLETAGSAALRKLCRLLADALEAALDRNRPGGDDSAALCREVNEGPRLALLALADLWEERGLDASALGLRWLGKHQKWPGHISGFYRWMSVDPRYAGGSSWTLPQEVGAALEAAREQEGIQALSRNRLYPTASAALLAAAEEIGKGLMEGKTYDVTRTVSRRTDD